MREGFLRKEMPDKACVNRDAIDQRIKRMFRKLGVHSGKQALKKVFGRRWKK